MKWMLNILSVLRVFSSFSKILFEFYNLAQCVIWTVMLELLLVLVAISHFIYL